MKKLLLTFFSLGMLFLTGCFQLPAEYHFSAHNVGGGFIIFEPFDICGGTPFPLHPSTCQSFDAGMSMPASRPHADTLSLNWRYWESVESYKKGDPGIACEQSVTLKPPCLNPEFYGIKFCFNQKEVFVVYRIIWNGWKDAESVLSDGCPFGYGEDLVGELSYFKQKPNSSYASFFKAMHKKYDYHPERRKNSNYFRLKWSPGKVVHYCKTDGADIFWGDVENIDDKNSVQRRFMRYGFEEIILKIIAKPDITQEEFTSFVKNSGKENECFISDDLTAWKRITEIVVRKKMLDPDKRFVKKITIPELQNQIAIIGLTPGKTFTLTFENVLSDEIKVDSKLIDRLKNQGYFSQISRICKK